MNPYMGQSMGQSMRNDCYDQYPCQRDDRDIYYSRGVEVDMVQQSPPMQYTLQQNPPMRYNPSPSRSRCYYDDQIINNATR